MREALRDDLLRASVLMLSVQEAGGEANV